MKRNIQMRFTIIALVGLMISCSTSNDVTSNRGIQKRKYTKGFYIDFNKKLGGFKNEEQIALKKAEETKAAEEDHNQRHLAVETVAVEESFGVESVDGLPNELHIDEIDSETSITTDSNIEGDTRKVENEGVNDQEKPGFIKQRVKQSSNKWLRKIEEAKGNAQSSSNEAGAFSILLLIILAIILPPLAVGIYDGLSGRFLIDLILWLVGIGVGYWLFGPGVAALCTLIAVIYAILIVVGAI